MSKWLRVASNTINVKDLNISHDQGKSEEEGYYVGASWAPGKYVTAIGEVKMGYGLRYRLQKLLEELTEKYPEGIDMQLIQFQPLQGELLNDPIVRRLGSEIADKIVKERKKWLLTEPSPRGWEDGGGTTTENAIKSINRPEENFEVSEG